MKVSSHKQLSFKIG